MDQPVDRRTVLIVGACLAALLVGGTAVAWRMSDEIPEPEPRPARYASAGVPWWDGRLHWDGDSVRVGAHGVASFTATRNAAVVLHHRRPARHLPDGGLERGRGTLSALFDDGSVRELATDVIGVPLADPTGQLVAWAVEEGEDSVVVTAYDTRARMVLGTQRVRLDRGGLTAVIGDTVYLTSGDAALAWHPRTGDEPEVVPGTTPRSVAVVGGGDAGLLVMGPQWRARWIGSDGTTQRVDAAFGSVSPDGRFVATAMEEDQYRREVQALPSGDLVDLALPDELQAYQVRWAGDGRLVVAAVARADIEDGWDDAHHVTSYLCEVPDGDCRELRGGPRFVGQLPGYDDSYAGMFLSSSEGMFS